MRYRLRMVVMAVLLGLASHAQAQTTQGQIPPAQTPPPAAQTTASSISLVDYKIGPRDTITVEVFKSDLIQVRPITVAIDGTIFLYGSPSLSAVPVAGLTAQLAQERIKAALIADKLFAVAPSVLVQVIGYRSQQVTITGEVRKFGIITLTADRMTLLQAIMGAGGLTTDAGPEIEVRRSKKLGERGTLNPDDPGTINQTIEVRNFNFEALNSNAIDDPTLQDNDYIYVRKAEKVTVTGEVANPGNITLQPGMTVIDAIKKAGGQKFATAAMNRLGIKRYDPKSGKYVDVKDVKETTLVQANDVINVPKKRIG